MVDRLVNEIRKALENDLLFVALSSALTLPDICGKAEYPDCQSSKSRYIRWYDENIGFYEKNPNDKDDMPYLSGEIIYNLRCALLHAGNPNIDSGKLKESLPMDKFTLVVDKYMLFNSYMDSCSVENRGDHTVREYSMNVRRVCMILCNVAEFYYKENKDKFHFNYRIIDLDEVASQLPTMDIKELIAGLAKK